MKINEKTVKVTEKGTVNGIALIGTHSRKKKKKKLKKGKNFFQN